jgi:SAM-dependent methyltransferase
MSSDYAIIAPIYERIGLSNFATHIASKLLTAAQQRDWFGRRILDLGCGTGGLTRWFAGLTSNYSIISVDNSPEMLQQMRETLRDTMQVRIVEGDIRALAEADVTTVDMALAIDTFNTLSSLRDIEAVFQSVSNILPSQKYFIFDLRTLSGLAHLGQSGDSLIYEDSSLVVFRRNTYDFERQLCAMTYHIFTLEGDTWRRQVTTLNYRAYPVQAVATLAKRYQFDVVSLTDATMRDVSINALDTERVIFMLQKL